MEPDDGEAFDEFGPPRPNAGMNLDDPEVASRWAAAEIPAQQIRMALAMGNHTRAAEVLQTAQHRIRRLSGSTALLETAVGEIAGLSQQTINELDEELDVVTIRDLLSTKPERYQALPNVGDRKFYALLSALLTHAVLACTAAEEECRTLREELGR